MRLCRLPGSMKRGETSETERSVCATIPFPGLKSPIVPIRSQNESRSGAKRLLRLRTSRLKPSPNLRKHATSRKTREGLTARSFLIGQLQNPAGEAKRFLRRGSCICCFCEAASSRFSSAVIVAFGASPARASFCFAFWGNVGAAAPNPAQGLRP